MALINCPECKKEVSDSAKSCPHCGFQLIEETTKKAVSKKKSNGCLTYIIIGIVLIVLISIMGSIGDSFKSSSSSSSDSSNRFLAYNYAKDFVEKKLKSPSTAKFPGTFEKDEHITDLGGGNYKIESWVDSQNSFGATTRTFFSCKIIFEGNNILCEDLIFE